MWYLDFSRLKFSVRWNRVFSFRKWELYRRFPGKCVSNCCVNAPSYKSKQAKKIISFFPEYDGEFSWLALNSDGGSVQVFDVPNRKVIKTISSYKVDN